MSPKSELRLPPPGRSGIEAAAATEPSALGTARRAYGEPPGRSWQGRIVAGVPLLAVLATCVGLMVALRAELVQVPYLNDSAMAEAMVRFGLFRLRHGHFPPGSWFPLLNLGSPQYLHYQSLGAMLTALVAWPLGVGRAFTLVLWLLVCSWPLSVYLAGRIFRLAPPAAAAAAVLAPFLSSFTHVGYELIGYIWSGYGLFSQLFAMWMLPIAWALCWRAVSEGRFVALAAVAVAATACFHFETGYLAFLAPIVFVPVGRRLLARRLLRASVVVAGAFLLSAWAIVPLVADGKWASINQFLQSGASAVDARSYGASRVLGSLFSGGVLDFGHFPFLTLLAACGLAFFCWPGRGLSSPHILVAGERRRLGLGLVVLLAASLVAFIGPSSIPWLLELVPGGRDLFFRRFVAGVQLSGLFLAGVGALALFEAALGLARAMGRAWQVSRRPLEATAGLLAAALLVAGTVAGWLFVGGEGLGDSALVAAQASPVARTEARQVDALLRVVRREGGGRVFAGDPSDYGTNFRIGQVPVFKYLATRGMDEVGFTLRTASLMSDPEVYFDDSDPADYRLFGIRFILYPAGGTPPVSARRVARRGGYVLYELAGSGYLQLVQTKGVVRENSGDLASFSQSFLSSLPSIGATYPTVGYENGAPPRPLLSRRATPDARLGRILSERADLEDGRVSARVVAAHRSVVLLSSSYDPGWVARVDGKRVRSEMIAPALVGLVVGRGRHTVSFTYVGYPDYPALGGLGLAGLVGLGYLDASRRLAEAPEGAEGGEGDRHRRPEAHEPEEEDAE